MRGLSLKPAARKIKRKTETMSLSLCKSKMTAGMTKRFFPYWFHASIFFSFNQSHHIPFTDFWKYTSCGKSTGQSQHGICVFSLGTYSVSILNCICSNPVSDSIFFSFSCDVLINHVVHIHLPKFKSYHLALFISTIVTKKNFMIPFFMNFF